MKKIFYICIVALGLVSCNSYLDINQDPNSPSEGNVTSALIFPGAEMNLSASDGDFLRIAGGYLAQHYSQDFGTSNYLDFSQFKISATRSSGTYTQLTARALKNLQTVRDLSISKKEWGTYLAATTLRGFIYQVLVDAYGETPYTEGLDIDNLSPHYDDGLTVYQGVLAEINDALSKVVTSDQVVTNFLFGSSSVTPWIQFANALKLKLLMRISDTQNVQSQLAALIAENNFPTKDIAWAGIWADETGKANPFYQEEFATYFGSTQVNLCANLALMQTMLNSEDDRVDAFFAKNSSGVFTGAISGTNFSTTNSYKSPYWCRPIATYNMPVYLISKFETEFFLAEYYARYGTSAQAETHYKAAIKASFDAAGVTGVESVYAAYPWDNANYKKVIGIQKWIALAGTNNFEAWCEMRRLKYPAFGTITGEQLYDVGNDVYNPSLYVPGTLYTPIQVNTDLGTGKVLQRFRFAESSVNRNSNAPEQKGDAVPVFWAEK